MSRKTQRSGDQSTNIQGDNVTVHRGLTYTEARRVALDVFKANFHELAGRAETVARERAEKLTDAFLEKLQRNYPEGIQQAEDPDFQYAMFGAQRDYARTGDDELGDLLVDLLIDRSQCDRRTLTQIVLNEALQVAPKLTEDQIAALTIVFLFKYTQNQGIGTDEGFGQYLDRYVQPFVEKLTTKQSCYQHLEFSACGSIGLTSVNLEDAIGNTYQGLFVYGFDTEEVAKREIEIGRDARLFCACLNDASKVQVRTLNETTLAKALDEIGLKDEQRTKIQALFNENKMSSQEIREKCVRLRSYMEQMFETWSGSVLGNFSLTSVGIAIAHANLKRVAGEFADLTIWID